VTGVVALAVIVAVAGTVGLPGRSAVMARGQAQAPGGTSPIAPLTPAFRGGVDLVQMGVTVTDRRGQLVTDLAAEDFEVYEDGVRQTIRYFTAGEGAGDRPLLDLHVGVLLDVSGSMTEEVGFMRTASIGLLARLADAVDVTLVEFDSEVRVTRFGPQDFPRLVERIRRQRIGGSTALYDAIGVYLDGADGQDGRTIMLVYTDGSDTRSALRVADLMDLLKASDVTVYVVSVLGRQPPSARLEARALMHRIAEATGGQAFFPLSVRELDAVYAQVLAQIRGQYILGYVATNERTDGTWREVEIKIGRPGARSLKVRARGGYYAALRGSPPP
jgi:VWFA-related protein